MARTKKAADANEIANREDLTAGALQSKISRLKAEGKRIAAAEKESDRLKAEAADVIPDARLEILGLGALKGVPRSTLRESYLRVNLARSKAKVAELRVELEAVHAQRDALAVSLAGLNDFGLSVSGPGGHLLVHGIGALARCLGCRASLVMSWVHDGMPHTIQDGTTLFDLPKVHRWILDRRESRVISDCRDAMRAQVVEIDANFDVMSDTLKAAIAFVTEEVDQTVSDGGVPGKPETILEFGHYARRLARLTDLARCLREAHADVPAPPTKSAKPVFTNLFLGEPYTPAEEPR